MFNVQEVLEGIPRFSTFCSLDKLNELVQKLRMESSDCAVEQAGASGNGVPIYHVRFGHGSVKVLVVAFPHCNEPIGGMTAFSLMSLMSKQHPALAAADVEWHIVPCIDPDGALLNEGWTQQRFTFGNYMKARHLQPWLDQVDCSFPVAYKNLRFNQPSKEASILRCLLDQIRPDFFFSLHNSIAAGGAWYLFSREIDKKYYEELREILEKYQIPLQVSLPHQKWCATYGEGMYEMFSVKRLYDDLERSVSEPENFLRMGAASWDYLAEIKRNSTVFVAELPYVKYPRSSFERSTGQNLRELKLKLDAENKFLITVILEEWEKVKQKVDTDSPFYRKAIREIISLKASLHQGNPLALSASSLHDLLFNPSYSQIMTEAERLDTYIGDRYNVLCHAYEFVRLLKVSPPTMAVQQAIDHLEPLFDRALEDMNREVDLDGLEVIDCDTLAKVQLGSGLIALNSVLESLGR